jgi:hypothetical protein
MVGMRHNNIAVLLAERFNAHAEFEVDETGTAATVITFIVRHLECLTFGHSAVQNIPADLRMNPAGSLEHPRNPPQHHLEL